ncbi:MAG: hypothetical protein ACPG7B_07945 [Pseudomonadales bacterium]
MVDAIRAAGGEVYAVTSEPQALASRAQEEWELSIECVGDPHQEIAEAARQQGMLDLRTSEVGEFITRDTTWGVSHPKGFYQPGVLALTSERLLYRWQSIPNRKNMGGAGGRPTEDYVWQKVQDALADTSATDAGLDEAPITAGKAPPFFLFSLMLMAHGWFIRPKAFTYQADGVNPMQRFPWVLMRLVAFLGCWMMAFVLLPTAWVGFVLALYMPIAILGVRKVYLTFAVEVPE